MGLPVYLTVMFNKDLYYLKETVQRVNTVPKMSILLDLRDGPFLGLSSRVSE